MIHVLDSCVGFKWLVVYDCLYVALAEQEGCEVVTTDARLLTNLQAQFPFIVSLSSLP